MALGSIGGSCRPGGRFREPRELRLTAAGALLEADNLVVSGLVVDWCECGLSCWAMEVGVLLLAVFSLFSTLMAFWSCKGSGESEGLGDGRLAGGWLERSSSRLNLQ